MNSAHHFQHAGQISSSPAIVVVIALSARPPDPPPVPPPPKARELLGKFGPVQKVHGAAFSWVQCQQSGGCRPSMAARRSCLSPENFDDLARKRFLFAWGVQSS